MFQSWFEMALLAAESQHVVNLRMLKFANGGPGLAAEAERMVSEKVLAGMSAAGTLMTGGSPDRVVADYRRRVQANVRRLSK